MTYFGVKPYGSDKMSMDKDLIEHKPYQIRDQFNKDKYACKVLFHISKWNTSIFMMEMVERARYLLFANDNKINLIMEKKS